jgi:predicted transposase YbfD/YdcC
MNNTILPFDVPMPEDPMLLDIDALYQRLSRVKDQRDRRGLNYSLAFILTIAVLGTLAGQDSIGAIAEWAQLRADELTTIFQQQKKKIPHPTTWYRIFANAVDPAEMTRAVAEVLAPATAEVPARGSILITFDGKTMRGTIPVGKTQGVHLVAAFRPDVGVVLVQMAGDQKENEIVVAPKILGQLDLTGVVVRGDAMHTQRQLSIQIVEQGGDYLWPVKDNQPTLRDEVERLFDPDLVAFSGGIAAQDFQTFTTVEKGHGRLEERTITVSRQLKDVSDWPYLDQVWQLDYRTTNLTTGEVTTEVAYGITSQPPDVAGPKRLLEQIREGWAIETGVHGRRDVTMGEDDAHLRQGKAAQVLATLNNTVIGIVLKHGYDNLARARRVFDNVFHKWFYQFGTTN